MKMFLSVVGGRAGLRGVVLVLVGLAVLAWSWSTQAVAADRVATFLRASLNLHRGKLTAAAAEMPADKYDFKTTADQLTFAYLVLHIADSNYTYCSYIGGVTAPQLPHLTEFDAKDKLVDRTNSSFEFCASAVSSLDDSHMSDTLTIDGTKMSRAMAILALTGGWVTHLELQQRYLELNGFGKRQGG